MAKKKRTSNRPLADWASYEDASQYRRSEYEGTDDYGFEEEDSFLERPPRGNANQYSRYGGSYRAREDGYSFDEGRNIPFLRSDRQPAGRGYASDYGYGYGDQQDAGDSQAYSRDSYGKRSRRHAGRRRRRIRGKLILIALVALLFVSAGSAFAYFRAVTSNLAEGLDPNLENVLAHTDLTGEPSYFLLLGTDASMERKNDETYGESFRTDTILLARIDPVDQKATLISMPRDTMIDMDEEGTQKLNAAYAIGGASTAVTEVSELAGVDISHFCLIDMDGLTSLVDALGGIEVDVPMEIDDADAGGHLDAGPQTLNGEQALILCRSRNAFEEYGAGDLYRAANQRLVLQAIASKILSSNPITIARSITAISEFVSTDLTVKEVIALAKAFQGIDTQQSIYTDSMPTTSEYIDDLWYEVVDEEAWEAMMDRVDAGLPPEESSVVDERAGVTLANSGEKTEKDKEEEAKESEDDFPFSGTVSVRNGTDVTGAGSSALLMLEEAGCSVLDAADADATDYEQTLVVYSDEADKEEAEAIAALLGSSAQIVLNSGEYLTQADFLVIIGADLAGDIAGNA